MRGPQPLPVGRRVAGEAHPGGAEKGVRLTCPPVQDAVSPGSLVPSFLPPPAEVSRGQPSSLGLGIGVRVPRPVSQQGREVPSAVWSQPPAFLPAANQGTGDP